MDESISSESKAWAQTQSIASLSGSSASTASEEDRPSSRMSNQSSDSDEYAPVLTASVYTVDGADEWCPTAHQRQFLKENLIVCGTWSTRSRKAQQDFIETFNKLFSNNKATIEEIGDCCCGLGGLKIKVEEERFMMVNGKIEDPYEKMSAGFHEGYPMAFEDGGFKDAGATRNNYQVPAVGEEYEEKAGVDDDFVLVEDEDFVEDRGCGC
jgi:hypothetical protein